LTLSTTWATLDAYTEEEVHQVFVDPVLLERVVIGGLLTSIAIGVAFGPELKRTLSRVRARTSESSGVALEPESSAS